MLAYFGTCVSVGESYNQHAISCNPFHLYNVYYRQCSNITLIIDSYLYAFRVCNRICQRTFVIKYFLFPYHITKIQKRLHIAIHLHHYFCHLC